jgi:hypothetical protein
MTQADFLAQIAQHLEVAGIPFMVAGSVGSSFHGQARATNDLDIVIDPTPYQLDHWLTLLGKEYYVDPDGARDALRHRSMFNIILFSEGFKADLIIRKDRPFSVEELQRRKKEDLEGHPVPIATPEDIILSKLEWNRITPSERQVQDALNVAVAQWRNLDLAYLRKWAPDLGVTAQLEEVLRAAEEAQRPSGA